MADRPTDLTRVLWVGKGLGPGGMERLLVHHANVGDRERFEYAAAYVVERPNSVIPELQAAGVAVHRLDHRLGPVDWGRSLRRLVRRERIDVVHLHSPALAAVARPALRTLRRRPAVITTEHNSWDCYSWPTRIANVATYPLDDARIAVSDDAVDSVPRPLRGTSEVLVHGIDLGGARIPPEEAEVARSDVRRELGLADDALIVLVVANHRAEKGWDVLLDAASIVAARTDDVVFLGVGHGQLEEHHRAEVARLGLGGSVRLLGFRNDVRRLIAAADVFALASRQEGLPVAVMEAMAGGRPVVAPDVGGLGEAVTERSGVLVAPEDPVALADALLTVLSDADLRERLGTAAAADAARFDVRRAVSELEGIYRRLGGRV